MYIVLLKFSSNKSWAKEFMDGHNAWIKSGLDDGVFLVVGSLQPNLGGAIVAFDISMSELESRLAEDPFVAEDIVKAEILEISPAKADERLQFLLA
jgi:uncharacterized protein YciI